jgi:hypothetical protein
MGGRFRRALSGEREAEHLVLLLPGERKLVVMPEQRLGREFRRLTTGGDLFDDIRSQKGEPNDAAHVALADASDNRSVSVGHRSALFAARP